MYQHNHAGGSRAVNSHLAEHATENLPSVGFPSLEDPAETIHKAPTSVNIIQGLPLRRADEGSVHPHWRRVLISSKVQISMPVNRLQSYAIR